MPTRVIGSTAENGSSSSRQARFQHQCPAEAEPLLLAAGQLRWIAPGNACRQLHLLEQFTVTVFDGRVRPPFQLCQQHHVLSTRQVRKQACPLHRIADAPAKALQPCAGNRRPPNTSTRPVSALSTALIKRSNVVLPLPLSPTTAVVLQDGNARSTRSRASCSPKRLLTPDSSATALTVRTPLAALPREP